MLAYVSLPKASNILVAEYWLEESRYGRYCNKFVRVFGQKTVRVFGEETTPYVESISGWVQGPRVVLLKATTLGLPNFLSI